MSRFKAVELKATGEHTLMTDAVGVSETRLHGIKTRQTESLSNIHRTKIQSGRIIFPVFFNWKSTALRILPSFSPLNKDKSALSQNCLQTTRRIRDMADWI